MDFDVIINVSDSPCSSLEGISPSFRRMPIHYWFPILELGTWGYEPLYGVKRVLDFHCLKNNQKCLLHCHAGACRSILTLYGYLESIKQEHLLNESEYWKNFIENKWLPKPPPFIREFLALMNDYPEFSVSGIFGLLFKDNEKEIVLRKFFNFREE